MNFVETHGMHLCWQAFGNVRNAPLLLLPGLGTQMLRWTPAFCQSLADHGFYVLRIDLRDSGLSTHLHDAPVPSFAQLAADLGAGRKPQVPYTLHDMVADITGLMDALKLAQAHVVGRSMGGMVAQLMAGTHPQRVLSLVSIMSSTGNPQLPQTTPDIMGLMMRPAPSPQDDEEAYLDHAMVFAQRIASPAYPEPEVQRALLRDELHRAHDPAGTARQIAAIAATGDLRPWLARVTAPTLVVHGADDVLIAPACGQDSATAIPGAQFLLVPGMGHDLPQPLHALLVQAIADNARRIAPAFRIRESTVADRERILEIWRNAVDDSHGFLSAQDRQAIEQEVAGFLPQTPLHLAVDAQGQVAGFMLLDGGHMEALFIDPLFKRRGVGRLLVAHALQAHPQLTLDVNEQNIEAVRFYTHLGFAAQGRSALDSQGRNYPIIHLRYAD